MSAPDSHASGSVATTRSNPLCRQLDEGTKREATVCIYCRGRGVLLFFSVSLLQTVLPPQPCQSSFSKTHELCSSEFEIFHQCLYISGESSKNVLFNYHLMGMIVTTIFNCHHDRSNRDIYIAYFLNCYVPTPSSSTRLCLQPYDIRRIQNWTEHK